MHVAKCAEEAKWVPKKKCPWALCAVKPADMRQCVDTCVDMFVDVQTCANTCARIRVQTHVQHIGYYNILVITTH